MFSPTLTLSATMLHIRNVRFIVNLEYLKFDHKIYVPARIRHPPRRHRSEEITLKTEEVDLFLPPQTTPIKFVNPENQLLCDKCLLPDLHKWCSQSLEYG